MLLLKIGRNFELEVVLWSSLYLRIGRFERFWNQYGLPTGSDRDEPVIIR